MRDWEDGEFRPYKIDTWQSCLVFARASALMRDRSLIWPNDWRMYAVDQKRGRCYYHRRTITIPIWALQREQKEANYLSWYISHELAHMFSWREDAKAEDGHGPNFMRWLKFICPEHCQHYEYNYKPRNAMAAGVSMSGLSGIDFTKFQ